MENVEIRSLDGYKLCDEVARQQIEELQVNNMPGGQTEPIKQLVSNEHGDILWDDRLAYKYDETYTFLDADMPITQRVEESGPALCALTNYNSSYQPPLVSEVTITINGQTEIVTTDAGSDGSTSYTWSADMFTLMAENTFENKEEWSIYLLLKNSEYYIDADAESVHVSIKCVEPFIKTIDKTFLPNLNFNLINGQGTGSLEQAELAEAYIEGGIATGVSSVALGTGHAIGHRSIATGSNTWAVGSESFSQGQCTLARGLVSHAEGQGEYLVYKINIPTEPTETITLKNSTTLKIDQYCDCIVDEDTNKYIVINDKTDTTITLSEKIQPTSDQIKILKGNAIGYRSHSEGRNTVANGSCAHSEGYYTRADKTGSHAEGYGSNALGVYSHAEGRLTKSVGDYSHSEGCYTFAIGENSHSQGQKTVAFGKNSLTHGSGEGTSLSLTGEANATTYTVHNDVEIIKGAVIYIYYDYYYTSATVVDFNSSEKIVTLSNTLSKYVPLNNETVSIIYSGIAGGAMSHTEGNGSIAFGRSQHVEGEYNIYNESEFNSPEERSQYIHIIGNGISHDERSNAHTLDWSGNAWFSGDVYIGSTSGTNKDEGSKKLATEDYINSKIIYSETEPSLVEGAIWLKPKE